MYSGNLFNDRNQFQVTLLIDEAFKESYPSQGFNKEKKERLISCIASENLEQLVVELKAAEEYGLSLGGLSSKLENLLRMESENRIEGQSARILLKGGSQRKRSEKIRARKREIGEEIYAYVKRLEEFLRDEIAKDPYDSSRRFWEMWVRKDTNCSVGDKWNIEIRAGKSTISFGFHGEGAALHLKPSSHCYLDEGSKLEGEDSIQEKDYYANHLSLERIEEFIRNQVGYSSSLKEWVESVFQEQPAGELFGANEDVDMNREWFNGFKEYLGEFIGDFLNAGKDKL